MAVLAYLAQRNVLFGIYLIHTDPDDRSHETARDRVYPRLDDDMQDLLASINSHESVQLDTYSRRVERALNKMRHHAQEVEPNLTPEWI